MATNKVIPPDEEDNKSLVNKSLFLVGTVDDALGTVSDVYKTNDRKRNTKKKGLLKETFNIKLASDLLNKKRVRSILKLLTGKDLRGLTPKYAKLLNMAERAFKGDISILTRLLPAEYQQLFSRLGKLDALQKRLFHTKSGTKRYSPKQIEQRNKADTLYRSLVANRVRTTSDTNNNIRSISDVQVEGQVYGDVLRDYSELDDPEEVVSVIREISTPRELQREIAVVASGDLANRGHINAINTLLTDNIITIENLISRYPDLVLRVVKNFKITYDDLSIPLADVGLTIITLLVKINPKWNVMLRGNSEVLNYKLYQLMSKDCRNAIIAYERSINADDYLSDVHTAPAIIGANIKTTSLETLLAKQFPDIPFSFK